MCPEITRNNNLLIEEKKPFKHQIEVINIAKNINFAVFHDTGLGKTFTCLSIFLEKRKQSPDLKMLVICPNTIIKTVWKKESEELGLKFASFKELNGQVPDILCVNYETFIRQKWFEKIQSLIYQYSFMVVVDESSRMKSNRSLTTKKILSLQGLKHKIVASGTPAPNSELELWGQLIFIAPHCINNSFYSFRNTYFHLERNGKKMFQNGAFIPRQQMAELMRSGWKYSITEENRRKLLEKIKPFTSWKKKEDIDEINLPETVIQIREISLSPIEKKAYNDMKKHLIVEIKDNIVIAQVALAKLMKLRQITSGFIYNEEKSIRIGNSKLNELENVIDDLGSQQTIIWCEFKEDIESIKELLSKKNLTFDTLYSETLNKEESVLRFKEKSSQFLIANPKSAAHGLNLQNCSTAIFYSLDYSYEFHKQAKDRIHRTGQKNNCLYIYLIAKNSIDQSIYKCLEEKQSLENLVKEIINS